MVLKFAGSTLALRVLAATLLESDDLGAALVVENFNRNAGASNGRHAEHRRIATEHEHFTKLHDRAGFASDLANLKYIIRNNTVLPAAGFDDCIHVEHPK